ncbi:hypothetical protein PRIC1_014013 [Phytophthora ramorum]
MRLLRNTFTVVAFVLLAVSDASSPDQTKTSAMTSTDTVLPTRLLVDGEGVSERFLRGNKGKTIATGDDDLADSEERLAIPSLLKSFSNKMSTELFIILKRAGNTPGRLAEKLNIGSPGTPSIYNRLYKRFTNWYAGGATV